MNQEPNSIPDRKQVHRKTYATQLNLSGIFFFGVSLFLLASLAFEFLRVNRNDDINAVFAVVSGLAAQQDITLDRMVASLLSIFLSIYLKHILIFISGTTCIFMGYLLLRQAGAIGKETISEQDQKLLSMLSENDEKGVGVDKYIRLTSLTGITGFFTKIGITGLPLATISLTLIFGILALLTPDTDASSKFFDFANLALGAFLGSYVQKQEPKSNIVSANNKQSK